MSVAPTVSHTLHPLPAESVSVTSSIAVVLSGAACRGMPFFLRFRDTGTRASIGQAHRLEEALKPTDRGAGSDSPSPTC